MFRHLGLAGDENAPSPQRRRRRCRAVVLATVPLVTLLMPLAATTVEARGVVLPVVFRIGPEGPEAVNAAILALPTVSLSVGAARPAFSNGGCTNNGTCNNLFLRGSNTFYVNKGRDQFLHGAATYSELAPVNDTHDGFFYTFGDTLTNITSDGDSICIIKNAQGSSSSSSSPIAYWPTGHRSTGSSGTETVGFTAGGASYASTFNVSEGYVAGDIIGNSQNGARFFGSWGYGDATVDQAENVCNLRGAAMESGVAFRTPAGAGQPHALFGATIYYQKNA